ncbi:unnamed protein product [Echinostoma caproni]|uniref:Phosphomevalonate kinase n=1 Tax=Echinostoma caproni TaxID=27848 RepID=A0A183ASC6_9TREM|nr:unnamed protein product [Echinostoma caproni]
MLTLKTVCIVITGKRKCGKDHTVNVICSELNAKSISHVVVHLSYPIKRSYAQLHGLDLKELLSSGSYKETYRKEMVQWSEEEKKKDPHIFVREALQHFLEPIHYATDVVLVADARRPCDISFFVHLWGRHKCILTRVIASEATRKARGWIFTNGIDDAETECALDAFSEWDCIVENDSNAESYHQSILKLLQNIENHRLL